MGDYFSHTHRARASASPIAVGSAIPAAERTDIIPIPPKRAASRWGRFRARRVLGIPAPFVAAFAAVLLTAGVAAAAIFFSGRINVGGQVRGAPDIRFLGVPAAQGGSDGNVPCVIPAPGTDGGGDLIATVTNDGRLMLNIDAYGGATFDLYVWFGIPDAAGVPTNLRIDSVDLGNPTALSAVFVNTLTDGTYAVGTSCTTSFGPSGSAASFSLLRSNTAPNNFLAGGSASMKITPPGAALAFFAFAIHLRITVLDTAPAGPLTGVATGIRVVPATP